MSGSSGIDPTIALNANRPQATDPLLQFAQIKQALTGTPAYPGEFGSLQQSGPLGQMIGLKLLQNGMRIPANYSSGS